MIRLQDIAEMAGVSRTTVSNVINGNTKRVSQKTIDKITAILKEQNYVPHMGSVMLSGHGSRIIGVVLGFTYAHGMQSLQDPFVGELIGNIRMETEEKGYYVMLIGGEDIQNVVDIASKWNVEGLIILGYNEERYRSLSRKLNKKMILIDAYPEGAYTFQNVGVDDYSGGYQIGVSIPVDTKRLCLLQKRIETVTIIDGWASSRRWKRKVDSAVVPDTLLFRVRKNTVSGNTKNFYRISSKLRHWLFRQTMMQLKQ